MNNVNDANEYEKNDEFQPAIPALVRTGVYVLGLIVGFTSIIISGISGIIWPEHAVNIIACTGVVGTAVGWLSSALGVAYRPTAPSPVLRPSGSVKQL